ncbi:hypothetical protein BH24PSE2_BH24PSE2_08800 [soil metagenome]
MINSDTRTAANAEHVAAKVMDGEAILINLSNGLYYRMGGIGGWIWRLIEGGHSVSEIAEAVAKRFDRTTESVLQDVQRMTTELLSEELIRIADGDTPRDVEQPDMPASYEPPALEKYSDMADMFALDPPLPGLAEVPAEPLPRRSED